MPQELDPLAPEDTAERYALIIPKPSELVSVLLKSYSPTFAFPDIQNAFKGLINTYWYTVRFSANGHIQKFKYSGKVKR